MAQRTQGKVVFIAHPLRGDVEGNLKEVERYIRFAIRVGHYPCCPWYAMVRALDESNDKHRELGLEVNFRILARCDELWACGHKISKGMKEEIDKAISWRIPVRYIEAIGTPSAEQWEEYCRKRGILARDRERVL